MASITGVNATFSNLNIKSGKAVLQFELDQTDVDLLPELSKITGARVHISISTAQQELVYADAETVDGTAEDAAAPTLPMLAMGA